MLPMQFRHEHRWDMPADQFKFFCYLIAHAASQRTPGVISGDAYSISRACRCKPQSVLSYVSRLIEIELIQEVTDLNAPRLEESRGEKKRKEALFSFPAWVFEEVGLVRERPADAAPYLTRAIFSKGIWQEIPHRDQAYFDRVFEALEATIHDDRWLAFVQTCLRNYVRRKREQSKHPSWHHVESYFFKREWWNDFRKDNGAIPRNFEGTGAAVGSPTVTGYLEHNISYPTSRLGLAYFAFTGFRSSFFDTLPKRSLG